MTDQESGAGGAELVRVVLRDLRAAAAQGRAYTDPAEVAGLIARLARDVEELRKGYADSLRREGQACIERDKAEAEVENHENERRYDNAERDQLRADLATARERIETLERTKVEYDKLVLRSGNPGDSVIIPRVQLQSQLTRLDSARAILEEAREFIYVHPSPRASLTEQCAMLDRIDSWLASGGKT